MENITSFYEDLKEEYSYNNSIENLKLLHQHIDADNKIIIPEKQDLYLLFNFNLQYHPRVQKLSCHMTKYISLPQIYPERQKGQPKSHHI